MCVCVCLCVCVYSIGIYIIYICNNNYCSKKGHPKEHKINPSSLLLFCWIQNSRTRMDPATSMCESARPWGGRRRTTRRRRTRRGGGLKEWFCCCPLGLEQPVCRAKLDIQAFQSFRTYLVKELWRAQLRMLPVYASLTLSHGKCKLRRNFLSKMAPPFFTPSDMRVWK